MNLDSQTHVHKISILHDFDNPYPSGRRALKRGIKLILYALSKHIPFLRRFVEDIYLEAYRYCITLAKIDALLGINSHFGLKEDVLKAFPEIQNKLKEIMPSVNIHMHYHISKDKVTWVPELDVPKNSWWFDQEFSKSHKIPSDLKWAVFHADYPELINDYIDFLFEIKRRSLI
jgi:hypothetical protein